MNFHPKSRTSVRLHPAPRTGPHRGVQSTVVLPLVLSRISLPPPGFFILIAFIPNSSSTKRIKPTPARPPSSPSNTTPTHLPPSSSCITQPHNTPALYLPLPCSLYPYHNPLASILPKQVPAIMPAAFTSTNASSYVPISMTSICPPWRLTPPPICSAPMPQKPLVSHVNMQLDSFLANSVSFPPPTAFTLLLSNLHSPLFHLRLITFACSSRPCRTSKSEHPILEQCTRDP